MTVLVVRASRPHVLILFYPTEAEFDFEFCKRLSSVNEIPQEAYR